MLSRKYFWLRLKHDFTHFSQSWLIYFETIDVLSVRLCHVMIHRFYLGFNILADYLHFAMDILENVLFLQKVHKIILDVDKNSIFNYNLDIEYWWIGKFNILH